MRIRKWELANNLIIIKLQSTFIVVSKTRRRNLGGNSPVFKMHQLSWKVVLKPFLWSMLLGGKALYVLNQLLETSDYKTYDALGVFLVVLDKDIRAELIGETLVEDLLDSR